MANRIVRVVAAVIERDGMYLITQRREGAVLPGLWEFPGGKVEAGETDERALHREVLERLGVDVTVHGRAAEHTHNYDRYDVHLSLYTCTLPEGAQPEARAVKAIRWVRSEEFADYQFPPADQRTMDILLAIDRS